MRRPLAGYLPRRMGGLGRNTLLTASGLVCRALLQAAYLLLVSRWLGTGGYGLFAGSVAAVILLAPLSNWGMGYVFTEYMGRGGVAAPALWRTVAQHAALKGLLFTLLVVAVAHGVMSVRVSSPDVALLALAELFALPLAQVASQAQLANRRGGMAAVTACLVPACRVAGASLLVVSGLPASVHALAVSHCLGSLAGMAIAILITSRVLRGADRGMSHAPPRWRTLLVEGAPYAFGALAAGAYLEIDKVLILQLVGAEQAGVYTAAFRVVMVLVLPMTALLSNALPRLFVAGDPVGRSRLLKAATLAALGYGMAAALLALAMSPWVPLLFGKGYAASRSFVALLAPWLPLLALHLCGATALVAYGGKTLRLIVEGSGLVLVVALDAWWLPRYGARAAIAALLVGEVSMAAACWWLWWRRQRRDQDRDADLSLA